MGLQKQGRKTGTTQQQRTKVLVGLIEDGFFTLLPRQLQHTAHVFLRRNSIRWQEWQG